MEAMCRLLGVVSSEATDFRFTLNEAPRCLAVLSPDHPHGWGIAVHARGRGWDLHKHAACAGHDERFGAVAAEARGEILVAHVRKRTVGPIGIENTHPFRRGTWVFAHNGTIEDTTFLAERTSLARRSEIEGQTDSELFFAYLLTALAAAGAHDGAATEDATEDPAERSTPADAALREAVAAAVDRPSFGAANFLLSDGAVLYAHRAGRTLHLLERGQGDEVIQSRRSPDATVETRWTARRRGVMLASERMTDEPWLEIPEGGLVRIDGGARPAWRYLGAGAGVHSVR